MRSYTDDPIAEQGNPSSRVASDMASHVAFPVDRRITAYRFAIFRTVHRRIFSASCILNNLRLVCRENQYQCLVKALGLFIM